MKRNAMSALAFAAAAAATLTDNGVVTLRGAAKNAAERDLVSKLVNDVQGVTGVNNRMTVEEPARK